MKNLILFRHGKSRWDENVIDINRSIAENGITKTKISAKSLKEKLEFLPDIWISSTGKRAYQTALITQEIIGFNHLIDNKLLYTFSSDTLTKFIRDLDDKFSSVVLFGHNPAFTEFIKEFTNVNLDNLPTSAVASIQFSQNKWFEIKDGKLIFLIEPKKIV